MPHPAITDDALMIRACEPGTEAGVAFGELVRRHESRNRRVAVRICGETHADEAVQEAWVSLWRGRAGYVAERGCPAAWMTYVVKLRSIDVLRRQRRHDARRSPAPVAEQTVACGAVDAVHHHTRLRSIIDALGHLPRAQQEALLLHHGGGLSQSEVAVRTGVALGTAKGRLRLGHVALRHVAIA